MDYNHNSQYDRCLKEFSKQHQKFISSALNHGEIPVVITTSRKMARIYKWMQKTGLIVLPKGTFVISEYSICFCMEELVTKYGNRLNVLITDDLVNTGKTVESIATSVAAYTGLKPKFLPLLLSEESHSIDNVNLLGEPSKVGKSFCSYATMRNVDNIMAMGMPIDMEYPILNLPMPRKWDSSMLMKTLQDEFPDCSVYSTSHGINDNGIERIVTYYTVLLDQEKWKQYSNSDFSKLRFFVGEDSLTIEVYSPKTIEESLFDIPVQFKNDSLQTIWHNSINETKKEKFVSNSDSIISNTLSYVVFANYLNSFVILKEVFQSLERIRTTLGVPQRLEINANDLNLIISKLHSETVAEQLNNLLHSEETLVSEQANLMYVFNDSVIPEKHRMVYENMNNITLLSCKNVFEGMCTLFSNQRDFLHRDFSIGESFQSISNLLKIFVKSDDISKEIHQCMDYMIDDASVAPSYMRIERNGRYFWKRLFRAGDNISLLEAMSGVITYVLYRFADISNRAAVEKKSFSTLLSLLFANRIGVPSFPRINGIVKLDQHDDYTSFQLHVSSDVNVLDYVQHSGLLDYKENNGYGCYEVMYSEKYGRMTADLFMDSIMRNDIDYTLSFIWKYSGHIPERLRFNMLQPDIKYLENSISVSISKLRALLFKYKENGVEGYEMDLLSNLNSLIKLSQGYSIITRENAPKLESSESVFTKQMWQSVFDIKTDGNYIMSYIYIANKLFIMLQLFVTLYEKIVSFDEEEARKGLQDVYNNSFAEKLDLRAFAELINTKQIRKSDTEKLILVCDNLLEQIQKL